jgi:DNA-repair protein XRCC1
MYSMLEMGAKYCGDWNTSFTHLVCAFANTPTFSQVVGKGIIEIKDWVEDCHRRRKWLPWRRFWLDKRDEGKDESEETAVQ